MFLPLSLDIHPNKSISIGDMSNSSLMCEYDVDEELSNSSPTYHYDIDEKIEFSMSNHTLDNDRSLPTVDDVYYQDDIDNFSKINQVSSLSAIQLPEVRCGVELDNAQ